MLVKATKWLLWATALTPLIYSSNLLFPFITSKALWLRILIEIALALFIILLSASGEARKKFFSLWKNDLVIIVGLFFVSAAVSVFAAPDFYQSFWGELERMEGLFTILHFWAFFLIGMTVFNKKDWLLFFKIVAGLTIFILLVAVLEFLGVENLPGVIKTRSRPDAFFGNSSYLGGYLLFIIGLAAIFYKRAVYGLSRWWWALIIVLSVVVVFLTSTRGSLIALAVAVLVLAVYWWSKILKNYWLISLLVIIVVGGGAFLITINQPFWRAIPGFDRLATLNLENNTVQSRLLVWQSGGLAILERPVFGWGLENFDIASNRHYNSRLSLYDSAWFDRAHNKLVEVGVMQGVLGLILYLAIFGIIFYKLWRWPDRPLAAALVFIFTAYFIHNLFLFDNLTSYLMFFGLVSFVAGVDRGDQDDNQFLNLNNETALVVGILVLMPLAYSLYFYHFIPYRQMRLIDRIIEEVRDVEIIQENLKNALAPFNYSQSVIRKELINFLQRANAFDDPKFNNISDQALLSMEELLLVDANEPRHYINLSEAYNIRSKINKKAARRSIELLEKAKDLVPKRQDVYYHLAYAHWAVGEPEKAVAVARQTIALAPEVAKPHYILGIIYSLTDERLKGEEAIEKAFEINQGLNLLGQDYINLETILTSNVAYHIQRQEADRLLKQLEVFKKIKPELEKDFNLIAELANKGEWSRLRQLVGM